LRRHVRTSRPALGIGWFIPALVAGFIAARKRAQRGGGGEVVALPTPPLDEPEPERGGGVERTTRAALTEAGRIETPMGQACLSVARRIDFPGLDTGSALAALVARLESSLSVATRGAGATSAPNALRDELAARRAQGA